MFGWCAVNACASRQTFSYPVAKDVVLSLNGTVTTNRHVPPLLLSSVQACVVACIASSMRAWRGYMQCDHDSRVCRHAVGKLRSRGNIRGGTRGLRWDWSGSLEHEVLEVSCIVLAVCASIARCLGRGSTLVAETLRRTCGDGVL